MDKAWISGICGALGAVVSNPFEIIMVRQTSDLGRTKEFQRGYTNLKDAYDAVAKEAGPGIWRGLLPHIIKMLLLNTVMIMPYDQIKERSWNCFGDNAANTLYAILVASLVGAGVTLPFDNLKTRMQNQYTDTSLNRMNYKGIVDASKKALMNEGVYWMWPGFATYYSKVVLYAILTIYPMEIIHEQCKIAAGLPEEHM